jgi:5-methylcytosine-specific restriction endonuclease McrA
VNPISVKRSQSLRTRAAIYPLVAERDGGLCVLCGKQASAVHEIIPRSAFGNKTKASCYTMRNMCCLCTECHEQVANPEGRSKLLRLMAKLNWYDYSDEPWSRYFNPY